MDVNIKMVSAILKSVRLAQRFEQSTPFTRGWALASACELRSGLLILVRLYIGEPEVNAQGCPEQDPGLRDGC